MLFSSIGKLSALLIALSMLFAGDSQALGVVLVPKVRQITTGVGTGACTEGGLDCLLRIPGFTPDPSPEPEPSRQGLSTVGVAGIATCVGILTTMGVVLMIVFARKRQGSGSYFVFPDADDERARDEDASKSGPASPREQPAIGERPPSGPEYGDNTLPGWVRLPVTVQHEDAALVRGEKGEPKLTSNVSEQSPRSVPLDTTAGVSDRQEKNQYWARSRAIEGSTIAAVMGGMHENTRSPPPDKGVTTEGSELPLPPPTVDTDSEVDTIRPTAPTASQFTDITSSFSAASGSTIVAPELVPVLPFLGENFERDTEPVQR